MLEQRKLERFKELKKDEVHVWYASLDLDAMHLQSMIQNLSSDEKVRAEGFCFPEDRKHYIATRGILREILSGYLKKIPKQLIFKYNSFGKPFLAGETSAEWLSFNLSHSRSIALYAFTWNRKVGIDLEYIRSDVAEDCTAEQTFSPREVAVLRSLPKDVQVRAFFNCWTRKEAFIKAKGKGLSIPLDQFDVSIVPGEPVRLLNTEWDADEPSRWKFKELNVGHEFVASLAVEGRGWYLKCWSASLGNNLLK